MERSIRNKILPGEFHLSKKIANNQMKISFLFFLTFLLWGCNSTDNSSSPFSEILSQPPYASITDSIRKQPGRDDLYFRRAVLLNKNNLPEPALADFKKAWSLAPAETYAVGVSNILGS